MRSGLPMSKQVNRSACCNLLKCHAVGSSGFPCTSGASLPAVGQSVSSSQRSAKLHTVCVLFGCHCGVCSCAIKSFLFRTPWLCSGLDKASTEDDVVHAPTLPNFGQAGTWCLIMALWVTLRRPHSPWRKAPVQNTSKLD